MRSRASHDAANRRSPIQPALRGVGGGPPGAGGHAPQATPVLLASVGVRRGSKMENKSVPFLFSLSFGLTLHAMNGESRVANP